MKIDLTCPLEIWRVQLPTGDYAACELTLYNLSEKEIASAEVSAILRDEAGEELARLVYRGHDLHSLPGKTCRMTVPTPADSAPASADVVLEKVWFDSGTIWRRGRSSVTEYRTNALQPGRQLDMLRHVAGDTAVGFPEEQQHVWMCVCGRANGTGEEQCIRCKRGRDEVFASFSREAVAAVIEREEQAQEEKARAVREEAASRVPKGKKETISRRKVSRVRRAVLIALLVCAALVYGAVGHLLPYLRYRNAVAALDEGRFDTAIAAFADMGDYLNAPDCLKKAQYGAAAAELAQGDEAHIASARSAFAALGDFEDSAAQVRQADYQLALLLLADSRLDEARALFVSLEDYADSRSNVNECDYQAAEKLLLSGEYERAEAAFAALDGYSDAAKMALDAKLMRAKKLLEENEFDEAISLLRALGDHSDAAQTELKAHYLKAQSLALADDPLGAGDEYLLAGGYDDAAFQAVNCIYQPAVSAMTQGDWYTAAELLAKIHGYEDADERYLICLFEQAREAVRDTEYIRATSLLAQLPEDYEGTAELRMACIYNPAMASLKKGDYQAAIEGFQQVTDYLDSAKQLQKAQYALAGKLAGAGDLAGAAALYEQLGSYSNSAARLKLTRYNLAKKYEEAGDYPAAIELYKLLGSYRQSANRLKAAQYAQAEGLLAAGSFAQAREIFASLGKYEKARAKVQACDYALADQLAKAGDWMGAASAFEALGSYEDAPMRASEMYYQAAQAQAEKGDMQAAASLFRRAGKYQDASAQAEQAEDAVFAPALKAAREALELGENARAAKLLADMDMELLPARYRELKTIFVQACYAEGKRLLDEGMETQAYPYLQRCAGYQDTAALMKRTAWMILGTWQADGHTYILRGDGTCELDGVSLLFRLDGYLLLTGPDEASLVPTHKLSTFRDEWLPLRDIRGESEILITFRRTAPSALVPLT